jgi:hypothetical protein
MGVFLLPASKRNPQSSGWSAPLEYELPPVDDEGRGSLDRSPAGHKVEAVRALRGRLYTVTFGCFGRSFGGVSSRTAKPLRSGEGGG